LGEGAKIVLEGQEVLPKATKRSVLTIVILI
jgi:hypothetical protein